MPITHLNLSELVVDNSMTLGQIKLIAKCLGHTLSNAGQRASLTEEEVAEVETLKAMFDDPELEEQCKIDSAARPGPRTHHGFCL